MSKKDKYDKEKIESIATFIIKRFREIRDTGIKQRWGNYRVLTENFKLMVSLSEVLDDSLKS